MGELSIIFNKQYHMALLNTSTDKSIKNPTFPHLTCEAEYAIVKAYTINKHQTEIQVELSRSQDEPNGDLGTHNLGLCEVGMDDPSFAIKCHEYARTVLGEQFEIININK